MKALFQDFFNKLFFRNEGRPTPSRIEWQTFTVCDPNNLSAAIHDLKETGWTIYGIEYDKLFTYVLAYRKRV